MLSEAYRKLIGAEAEKALNNISPGLNNIKLGSRMRVLENHTEIVLKASIDKDASGGILFGTLPFDFEVIDIIAHGSSTNASGTVQLADGDGNAISDAVAMDTDGDVNRATSIDLTYSYLKEGDNITLTTNGAGDRGDVFIIGIRASEADQLLEV